jgi:HK97 family phage major capsid protein
VENTNLTPEEVVSRIEAKINEKAAGFVSKDELTAIKSDIAAVKELAEKSDLTEVKTTIAKIEGMVEGLKEQKSEPTSVVKTLGEAISNAYEKSIDAIKGLGSGQTVSLDVKAAGTMTITDNYSGGTVGLSSLEPGLTRVQRRRAFLRQLINVAGTISRYVVWIEQANPDPGAAGMTAEGAAKTQTDFDLIERSSEVKKISAYIKVSKEMLADIAFMRGEINNELMELVQLKLDEQILLGDGLGNNLAGIDANAIAFSAGSFAGTIPSANNTDVLRVAIAQIAGANFEANYIVLNPVDAAALELTKDSSGAYTYPVNMVYGAPKTIYGIPVIENNLVPAGEFYVGDFSKSNLRVREDMNIQVGYVNDDFTKNLITILCEARAAHFVKVNHYDAFVKGDFATAKAALELV